MLKKFWFILVFVSQRLMVNYAQHKFNQKKRFCLKLVVVSVPTDDLQLSLSSPNLVLNLKSNDQIRE
jgi:hypothetical protein